MRPDVPGGGGGSGLGAGEGPAPAWPAPSPPDQAGYPGMVSIPAQPGSPESQGGKGSRGGQRSRTRRSRPRRGLLVTGLVLALVGLAAATVMVVRQVMPRTFTASQRSQITAWEVGNRWRTWPAAQIFPAGIKYQ